MSLNNDIIAKIVSYADVPIDTYLAFKNIGAIPKKLKISTNIKNKLNTVCNKHVKQWKQHNEFRFPYSAPLYCNRIDLDIKLKIRINGDDTIRIIITLKILEHIIDDDEIDQITGLSEHKGNLMYSLGILFINITRQTARILRREHWHIRDGTPSNGFYDNDDDIM